MVTRTANYGTKAAFGSASNLDALASAAAKPLGEVDNGTTTKADDYSFFLKMALAASGVSATGTINIYLLESQVTGADQTDGISMTATGDQAANIKTARLIATLPANANSQIVRWNARLLDYVSFVPKFWSLLVENKSGAALLGASNNDASYTPLKEDIA